MTPREKQEAAASALTQRPDMIRRLRRESARRISTVRKIIGLDRLPTEELDGIAQSALAFGFYRALLNRFTEEQGLSRDWWREKRKAHARSGKDRTNDLLIIGEHRPDFYDFFPSTPLTDEEVFTAAMSEFRDLIAGPGSDYYELETQKAKVRRGISAHDEFSNSSWGVGTVPSTGDDTPSRLMSRDDIMAAMSQIDVLDHNAQDRVENVLDYNIIEDENHVLGPAVTRALVVAEQRYGPSAMYWLADLIVFSKKYTEMLRVLGGDEQTLGLKEFERVKRDMVRKLPGMNETILDVLRTDPEMLALREILHADVIPPTAKIPEPFAAKQSREVVKTERPAYMERQRAKLLKAVEADSDIAEYAAWLRTINVDTLLPEFIAATDGFKWQTFKKHLRKLFATEHQVVAA